jgi:hypothetical protein
VRIRAFVLLAPPANCANPLRASLADPWSIDRTVNATVEVNWGRAKAVM